MVVNLTERNVEILKIIVEEYLQTWGVLWSKLLLKKYNLGVSSATVRNDMAKLETLELIHQPYNSAWRLPTCKWLRAFINYLMKQTPDHFLKSQNLKIWDQDIKKLSDFTHKITFELSQNTKEIAFFISQEKHIWQYNWIASFLRRNHKMLWDSIYSIIQILEDKFSFIKFIESFPIWEWVNVFIWEENILPYLKDYTIIVKPLNIDWEIAYIWIIWWLKMNYSFNISAVRWII